MQTQSASRTCIPCNVSTPATVCTPCAQEHTTCAHPEAANYCTNCAMVYDIVANCFDEPERETLEASDYEVWATDSAMGAPQDDLDLIDGWNAGWQTSDGQPWPVPERHALTPA